MTFFATVRREWAGFRRPGRLIALAAAALAVIALGLLFTTGNQSTCDGTCPSHPVGADGTTVSDHFWFKHRDLGRQGSITVRLTAMTGTITYPPPHHEHNVSGLVPWAKTGIIIKDGTRQGSRYAALMLTGDHGVRFQYDYDEDVAGTPGGVSAESPRWLRLTRSGDTISGAESADGQRWHTVGTATLDGLPDTMRVGLFAASPSALTLDEVALGGSIETARTTQAVGVFDNIAVDGGGAGRWRSESVGEMNKTELEKEKRHPSGAVSKDGTVTISGLGDIGPAGEQGGAWIVTMTLSGLVIALVIVLVVAARYGAGAGRDAVDRRVLAARATLVGVTGFATGLLAVGTVLPVGLAILRANEIPVPSFPASTTIRVVAGVALALALCAVFTYGLGVGLRRGWAAILAGLALVALPYAVTAVPLLPDAVSQWLLRNTPAAGFAVQQTMVEYPQVTAHYAPSAGYFPLPWWGGLAVLGAYTAVAVWLALARNGRPLAVNRG